MKGVVDLHDDNSVGVPKNLRVSSGQQERYQGHGVLLVINNLYLLGVVCKNSQVPLIDKEVSNQCWMILGIRAQDLTLLSSGLVTIIVLRLYMCFDV